MRTIEMAKNEDQTSSDTHNQFKQSYSVWRTIMHFAGATDALFKLGQVNTTLDEYSKSVYGFIDIHHPEHSIDVKFHPALKYFLRCYERIKQKRDQGLIPVDCLCWSPSVYFRFDPSFKELLMSILQGHPWVYDKIPADFDITPILNARKPSYLVLNTILSEKQVFPPDFNEKMLSVRGSIKEFKESISVTHSLFHLLVNTICVLLTVPFLACLYDDFTERRLSRYLNFTPRGYLSELINFFMMLSLCFLFMVTSASFLLLVGQFYGSIRTIANYFERQKQLPKFEWSENLVSFFETAAKRHLKKTESCVASNNTTALINDM